MNLKQRLCPLSPLNMRSFSLYSLGLLVGIGLIACGSPEVPLTRPPQNAFRVEEPVTTPPTTDPLIATLLEREATELPSVLALAAQFWGLTWPPEPPILQITARFFGLDWPPAPPEAETDESTVIDEARSAAERSYLSFLSSTD